ncbi:hypothetical protein [Mangrovibacter phragmitis]|uniref:hypothetical protein n=1 Tax=Mangrovibacter phragmitis TaxID=1691903 RepID=UPI00336AA5B5
MQHSVFKAVTVAVFYMALSLMYSAVLLLSHGSDVIKWYMTHAWLFTATLAGSVTPDVWGWTTALNTLAVALIFLAAGGFLSVATGVLMVLPGRLLARVRWRHSLRRCRRASLSLN